MCVKILISLVSFYHYIYDKSGIIKTKLKPAFPLLSLFCITLLLSCHKQASIDQTLLSGTWVEIQCVNQHGSLSNGVITLAAGQDTLTPTDTIIFSTASRFIHSYHDTIRGTQSDTGTYSINGNSITINSSVNIQSRLDVISLSSHQLVVKSTQIDSYLNVAPTPVTISTITYIHQ